MRNPCITDLWTIQRWTTAVSELVLHMDKCLRVGNERCNLCHLCAGSYSLPLVLPTARIATLRGKLIMKQNQNENETGRINLLHRLSNQPIGLLILWNSHMNQDPVTPNMVIFMLEKVKPLKNWFNKMKGDRTKEFQCRKSTTGITKNCKIWNQKRSMRTSEERKEMARRGRK